MNEQCLKHVCSVSEVTDADINAQNIRCHTTYVCVTSPLVSPSLSPWDRTCPLLFLALRRSKVRSNAGYLLIGTDSEQFELSSRLHAYEYFSDQHVFQLIGVH